jgi:hypothetical protein
MRFFKMSLSIPSVRFPALVGKFLRGPCVILMYRIDRLDAVKETPCGFKSVSVSFKMPPVRPSSPDEFHFGSQPKMWPVSKFLKFALLQAAAIRSNTNQIEK